MTRHEAQTRARADFQKYGIPISIVREGPHADEFAEFDDDGNSYGFCPCQSVSIVYMHAEVVDVIASVSDGS